MLKRIAAAAFLVLLPCTALAGSFDGTTYKSNLGYSIRPPQNWMRVDAATVKGMAELDLLPSNITPKVFPRTDVIFFPAFTKTDTSLRADRARTDANIEKFKEDPNAALTPPITVDDPHPDYSAAISVSVFQGTPSAITTEMAKSYKEGVLKNAQAIEQSNGNFIKNLTINEATAGSTTKNYKAFMFEFEYDIDISGKNYHIKSEQTLIFKDTTTYMVTCSSDHNAPPDGVKANWCRTVVNSLKINN
ncbi:MAG: hypothetical protein II767_06365 [Proteobacteria bacterium]|nr:hypothetical protein [Pseudomonadota bacterium]